MGSWEDFQRLFFSACCVPDRKTEASKKKEMPNISSKFEELTSLDPTMHSSELPDSFLCPISKDLMQSPVKVPRMLNNMFVTCDKESIEKWLKENPTSPFDRRIVTLDELEPDFETAEMIYSGLQTEIDSLQDTPSTTSLGLWDYFRLS